MTRSPCQTFPKSRVFPVIITKRIAFVNSIFFVFGPFFRLQTICLQKVFIFHRAERLLDVFEDGKETFFKKVLYRGCGGRAPDISCLSAMREHRQKPKKATQSRGFSAKRLQQKKPSPVRTRLSRSRACKRPFHPHFIFYATSSAKSESTLSTLSLLSTRPLAVSNSAT